MLRQKIIHWLVRTRHQGRKQGWQKIVQDFIADRSVEWGARHQRIWTFRSRIDSNWGFGADRLRATSISTQQIGDSQYCWFFPQRHTLAAMHSARGMQITPNLLTRLSESSLLSMKLLKQGGTTKTVYILMMQTADREFRALAFFYCCCIYRTGEHLSMAADQRDSNKSPQEDSKKFWRMQFCKFVNNWDFLAISATKSWESPQKHSTTGWIHGGNTASSLSTCLASYWRYTY